MENDFKGQPIRLFKLSSFITVLQAIHLKDILQPHIQQQDPNLMEIYVYIHKWRTPTAQLYLAWVICPSVRMMILESCC